MLRSLVFAQSVASVLLLSAPVFAGHDCPWCSSKPKCACAEAKKEVEPKETLGPCDMPCRLEGCWKVTLCIECKCDHQGHAWLRYEKIEEPAADEKENGKENGHGVPPAPAITRTSGEAASGNGEAKDEEKEEKKSKKPEVHTVGRYRKGHGGAKGVDSGEYIYEPAPVSGVIYDLDLKREKQIEAGEIYMISTTVVNPIVFKGENKGFRHDGCKNNCATHGRDGWYYFTGEYYELGCLAHTSDGLLKEIAKRHPEILCGH